ncbi:hypothetical protein Aperf_G00000077919 [Anoplocephala perfoliata]
MSNTTTPSPGNAEAIDSYLLYHRIVGDDDNGRIFSPDQYEAYKRRVFPMSETAEERKARGHPVGQPCVFQAMGGLTGFSSLLPGTVRMDSSGTGGHLTERQLDAPITMNDHPFLRAHAALIEAFEASQKKSESKGSQRDHWGYPSPFNVLTGKRWIGCNAGIQEEVVCEIEALTASAFIMRFCFYLAH